MPKLAAAALALYSAFLIDTSLPNLPSRISTHFNMAGEPDGWGSPHALWLMLGLQVLLAVLMFSIPFLGRRFPASVHFGTANLGDFTPEQRDRVWPLLDRMAGWMGVATSLFFVYVIREVIHAASSSRPRFRVGWVAALFVGAMAGISIHYVRRINRVVRGSGH